MAGGWVAGWGSRRERRLGAKLLQVWVRVRVLVKREVYRPPVEMTAEMSSFVSAVMSTALAAPAFLRSQLSQPWKGAKQTSNNSERNKQGVPIRLSNRHERTVIETTGKGAPYILHGS